MAKAVRNVVEVEKVIKEKVTRIVLELTPDEAQTLREVTGNIGGSGLRRDHIDAIWLALGNAGFSSLTNPFVSTPILKDN